MISLDYSVLSKVKLMNNREYTKLLKDYWLYMQNILECDNNKSKKEKEKEKEKVRK